MESAPAATGFAGGQLLIVDIEHADDHTDGQRQSKVRGRKKSEGSVRKKTSKADRAREKPQQYSSYEANSASGPSASLKQLSTRNGQPPSNTEHSWSSPDKVETTASIELSCNSATSSHNNIINNTNGKSSATDASSVATAFSFPHHQQQHHHQSSQPQLQLHNIDFAASVIAKLEQADPGQQTGGVLRHSNDHHHLQHHLSCGSGGQDYSNIISSASNMAHFQMESPGVASVIKTAPGRSQVVVDNNGSFSPKHEPLGGHMEMAPLSQASLQDLSKMQPSAMDHMPYSMSAYSRVYPDHYALAAGFNASAGGQSSLISTPYYPPMFPSSAAQDWSRPAEPYMYQSVRPLQPVYSNEVPTQDDLNNSFRLAARSSLYNKPVTVDMPSPVDSGIGGDINIVTPNKEHDFSGYHTMHASDLLAHGLESSTGSAGTTPSRSHHARGGNSHRSGNNSSVNNEPQDEPVHIPKLQNSHGFQYVLEAPISTSVRKEDDKMTYVNKGQFYTVTLEYVPDVCKPLKSATVRTVLAVVFRDDKTYDEEIKTWQYWHQRQHSPKQRIIEVDAKNSHGMLANNIEEISHNAVQFYWDPNNCVKISIAVQCLSTDFSTQKGVKGLPLHVQIDTYDEAIDDKIPFHRGYCQIKVFCDKGANRKMLHENRRDEKRRMQGQYKEKINGQLLVGRKKADSDHHEPCDRSEFYHMSDLTKPVPLFIAPDDYDPRILDPSFGGFDQMLIPTRNGTSEPYDPPAKRPRSSTSDRLMLYVRKPDEVVFTPLHLVPPSLQGLLVAVVEKFGVDCNKVTGVYKQCRKGVTVKVDDDMLRHYCNEDTFVLRVDPSGDNSSEHVAITLVELEERGSPASGVSSLDHQMGSATVSSNKNNQQQPPQNVQVQ